MTVNVKLILKFANSRTYCAQFNGMNALMESIFNPSKLLYIMVNVSLA